ncbi:hypothetical protein [Alteromonas sp. CYL-A6]|uniref:hypothetical protein n=1 Tax=Alteromonas nitratireducens TaxID=3390813 RepID=UPI0034BDE3BA
MTNQQDRLDKAYQQFKRRYHAPASAKRYLLRVARGRSGGDEFVSWGGWARAVAGGVALLAVGVFVMMHTQVTRQRDMMVVSNVQLHGYAPSTVDTEIADHKRLQRVYYAQYLQQDRIMTARYSQSATVLQNQGELALTTCKDELIKLSDSLVSRMIREGRLPVALRPGETVTVGFDDDGYIVALRRLPEPRQC